MFETVHISDVKKPERKVYTIFLHCSASDNPKHDDAKIIDGWHRARGFSSIGYHFFIKKDGTIQAGRSLESIPAAQHGHNTATIAICVHGLKKENFTPKQLDVCKGLCLWLDQIYGRRTLRFKGHKEVDGRKTCPVFDYANLLGLDSEHKICYNVEKEKNT